MTAVQVMGAGVAIAILYPIAMRLIAEAIQPMRLRMADLGVEVLQTGGLNEVQKKLIKSMLDDAFDWRFMIFAALCVPIVVIRRGLGFRLNTPFDEMDRADTVESIKSIQLMHLASVAAANPLFAAVVSGEFAILGLALLIGRTMGHMMSIDDTFRRISVIVEEEHGRQVRTNFVHSAP